jgi:hypothetical protein
MEPPTLETEASTPPSLAPGRPAKPPQAVVAAKAARNADDGPILFIRDSMTGVEKVIT